MWVGGVRVVIMDDENRVLVVCQHHEDKDIWMVPGGGIEEGESLAECCIREMAEETGVEVEPYEHYLTLEEYYHEYYFKSHYFLCRYVGECERSLTENEKENGLEPRWVDFDEALMIFGNYEKYKNKNELNNNLY